MSFLCMGPLLAMEREEVRHVPAELKVFVTKNIAPKISKLLKEQHSSPQELTNALALAIMRNNSVDTAILLHAGAQVNQLATITWPPLVQAPPLYLAAFYRNPLFVKWLLIFGADPNLKLPVPLSSYDATYNCNRKRFLSHSPLELAQGWDKRKDQQEAEKEAAILQLLTLPREHFQNPTLKQEVK